jgi:GTPase SAR1 family protein
MLMKKIKEKVEGVGEADILKQQCTVPTIGVDLLTLSQTGGEITLREVGSTMISKWTSYADDCSAIILVVDLSDLGLFSSVYVLLLEVISHIQSKEMSNWPVLIACNKTDLATSLNLQLLLDVLDFDLIRQVGNRCNFSILQGNCMEDANDYSDTLGAMVLAWIASIPTR